MKIAFVGDMAFFGRFDLKRNRDVGLYFDQAKAFFSDFDFVVGNLEVPLVGSGKRYGSKSAYISSDPINVELIKELGINVVNLANNHIYDFGREGLDSTIRTLELAGIYWFGVDGKDLLLESSSAKVAFQGVCSYNTNPLGADPMCAVGVNALNYSLVFEKIGKYRDLGYLNVLSVHAGQEHVNFPGIEEIRFSRDVAEESPYIYYGHHPHVLQGVESYKNSILAHSLGNFCFDDVYTDKSEQPLVEQNDNNKTGGILAVEVSENRVSDWSLTPFFLGDHAFELNPLGAKEKLQGYSVLPVDSFDDYRIRRNEVIQKFFNSRKNMRDLRWYLVRLRLSSIGIILRSKYNAYMHKKFFTSKISCD